ncbi:MAG: LysE family translocator [Kangiellaceae bacterium]|jgi:threonine/homoserine/homoserine lactone efflux protein|nr:LysE family translocator [Kangiellaceae bacterium]
MTDYLFLLPLTLAFVLGVMSPGPSFLVVVQTSVSKSRTDGIACSIGLAVGVAVFAIIASLGLFVVLESVPTLFIVFKLIGGGYLCFLAYKIWNNGNQTELAETQLERQPSNITRSFFTGLATQLSNPKTALALVAIFASLLPEQVPEFSYLVIAMLAFTIDAIWYSIISILLSTRKAQNSYLKYKKAISRTSASFLAILGIKLATDL